MLYEGKVVGLPVQTPWVDVRSIGAGGGSIAYVDVGGLLRVGPGSAGADPGPACYGRGGTRADRDRRGIRARHARRGRARRRRAARRARPRARRWRRSPRRSAFEIDDVARGILTIATANMANAIREITVEQGVDPRARDARRVRRRRPALRHAARARARASQRDRRPALRRQLLGLGPARRRPDAVRGCARESAPRRRGGSPTSTAFSATCSPRSSRARHDAGSDTGREVALRHALRRPGAHADDRRPGRRGPHRRLGRRHPRPVHPRVRRAPSATRWTRRSRSCRCGRRCARRCRAGAEERALLASTDGHRGAAVRGVLVHARRAARLRDRRPRDRSRPATVRRRARRSCSRTTATTYLDAGFTRTSARVRLAVPDRRGGVDADDRHCRTDRLPRRDGQRERRRRRRSDHDRGDPPRPELGGRADEARARPHRVLAGHLRGARLRRRASTTATSACSRRRRACRSSWAR